MKLTVSRLVIAFACLTPAAWSQVDVPMLGYVPEGGRIRPVYGIPASAGVAGALDLGREFSKIAISPQQNLVLGAATGTGEVWMVRPNRGATRLEGANLSPDRIAMSPGGSSAVLWFAETNSAQVVSNLATTPSIRSIGLSFLQEAPTALAISDDGNWLAGAWTSGVYGFGPNGEFSRLPVEDSIRSIAFFAGKTDLAIAGASRILAIQDIGGGASLRVLLDGADALDPVALTASADNRRVVAVGRSGSIAVLDPAGGLLSTADCGCTPEGLFAMGRTSFRLTGLKDGAFKLFDVSSGEVLFAPLASTEEQQ